jgi:hypothetical protein
VFGDTGAEIFVPPNRPRRGIVPVGLALPDAVEVLEVEDRQARELADRIGEVGLRLRESRRNRS